MAAQSEDEQTEAMAALDALGPVEAATEADKAPTPRKRVRRTRAQLAAAKASGEQSRPPRPPRSHARKSGPKIADGMAQLYTVAGMALSAVPSRPAVGGPMIGAPVTQVVGLSLAANAADIGAAWEQAAKDDPRIREAIERLLTVSTFGAILAAHAPVIMAGVLAGGLVPAGMMSDPPESGTDAAA